MVSIIIPAHNEEQVISRCLGTLFAKADDGEIEVIVVCNGCTDNTAEKAMAFGSPYVKVLETNIASKTVAMNMGDELALYFPRFYLDADVLLPVQSIRNVVNKLHSNRSFNLASPVAHTDLSSSSFAVRSFYKIWQRMPYNRVMVGTGVFVLTKEGRNRFGQFPSVISDDGFVRSRFASSERLAVVDAPVTVFAPKTFKDLIKVQTRSRLGLYQLEKLEQKNTVKDRKNVIRIIRALPVSIMLPLDIAIYIFVNIVIRIGASKKLKKNIYVWDRDEANRLSE